MAMAGNIICAKFMQSNTEGKEGLLSLPIYLQSCTRLLRSVFELNTKYYGIFYNINSLSPMGFKQIYCVCFLKLPVRKYILLEGNT